MRILLFWLLLVQFSASAEREIVAYRVGLSEIERLMRGVFDQKLPEHQELEEAPFKSRFFEEGDILWDYTKRAKAVGNPEGTYIYDKTKAYLVISASLQSHEDLRSRWGHNLILQIRTEVSLVSIPGATLEREILDPGKLPDESATLAVLSALALPGQSWQVTSYEGEITVNGECQCDANDSIIRAALGIQSTFPKTSFHWKSGLATIAGTPQVAGVWSLDGQKTLVLIVRHEFVLNDGTLLKDWRIPEVDHQEVVNDPQNAPELPEKVRRYQVPPTFETFLTHNVFEEGGEDPFGGGSEREDPLESRIYKGDLTLFPGFAREDLIDVREFLEAQGLVVKPENGDFIFLHRKLNCVFAHLTPTNHELLDGIVKAGTYDPPILVTLEFSLVRSGEKLTSKEIEAGAFEMVQKIGMIVFPGQEGILSIGGVIDGSFEALIDANGELLEMRINLSEKVGKESRFIMKTGFNARVGERLIIHQSQVGDQWFTWIGAASLISPVDEGEGK